jgi:hypothetical protein
MTLNRNDLEAIIGSKFAPRTLRQRTSSRTTVHPLPEHLAMFKGVL